MPSEVDLNGWKEIKDNPLSCVGVYPYMGKDIPGAPDPTAIYNVLRPEEELADPECIASFKLLPWINDHVMLGEGATPAEQKGVQGVIGEDVYFRDGQLLGNIKIFGGMLADLIQKGKKELSCGYRCMYEAATGIFQGQSYDYVQRQIRGNHLALVEEGRMGASVAVFDCSLLTFTIDSKGLDMADENEEKKEGEGGEDAPADMTLADAIALLNSIMPQIAKLNDAVAKLSTPATPAADPEDAPIVPGADADADADADKKAEAQDAKIKKLESQIATLTTAADAAPKNLFAELEARNKLYSKLSAHTGAFDHSLMTVKDVAAYGVKKLGLACDSGSEVAALNGFLHGRSPATPAAIAQDSKGSTSAVDGWLNGEKA